MELSPNILRYQREMFVRIELRKSGYSDSNLSSGQLDWLCQYANPRVFRTLDYWYESGRGMDEAFSVLQKQLWSVIDYIKTAKTYS